MLTSRTKSGSSPPSNGKQGILLDLGCKDRKQSHWYGVDWRQYPGVDLVRDLEDFPYPFADESVLTIKAAHLLEHLQPRNFFPFMDECWRLLKLQGQMALSMPYAGSPGFWQDPTHTLALTEKSWQYLDPDYPMYAQYRPKPWKIEAGFPVWHVGGNLEVILRKRPEVDYADTLARRACELGAMQKPGELRDLIGLLRPLPLRTVVEIGTARGGVFWVLCQLAAPDALVVSIDLPGGPFGGGYTEQDATRYASYGRETQRLLFLPHDSHALATKRALQKTLHGREIDLLFIDGDHTYQGVRTDYKMYSPLVAQGGLIVFHDICHHPTVKECQVERFWRELKATAGHQTQEFIDAKDVAWGGIGVLWKT